LQFERPPSPFGAASREVAWPCETLEPWFRGDEGRTRALSVVGTASIGRSGVQVFRCSGVRVGKDRLVLVGLNT
jgi:hypothetical protein